jgi:hypothetical protein
VSAVHPSRPPGESILEVWFEKGGVQCTFDVAAGADPGHVHAQMLTLLTEAASGQYWDGHWKRVDLDARWHLMRVTIDDDGADLGDGHLDAHHSKRLAARDLIAAARDHLAARGVDGVDA